MMQARFIDVPHNIVIIVDVKDMVQVFGIAEMLVMQQRLARPVAARPEVQDVETFPTLIQQIIQRFREGILHGHTDVLGKGIAEDADVGSRGQVGCAEIPMLAEGEIVVMEGVRHAGIRMIHPISRVRRMGPDPHRVSVELRFG